MIMTVGDADRLSTGDGVEARGTRAPASCVGDTDPPFSPHPEIR
jgi:hypothetical protein